MTSLRQTCIAETQRLNWHRSPLCMTYLMHHCTCGWSWALLPLLAVRKWPGLWRIIWKQLQFCKRPWTDIVCGLERRPLLRHLVVYAEPPHPKRKWFTELKVYCADPAFTAEAGMLNDLVRKNTAFCSLPQVVRHTFPFLYVVKSS